MAGRTSRNGRQGGIGVSIVPTLTLFQFRHDARVSRPLAIPTLRRSIYLIRRREGGLSIAAKTMHDLVLKEIGVSGPH